MKIDLKKEEKKLTIKLDGKLDTNTSPELDSKMSELEGVEEVVIDMKDLDYILLSMQKVMNKQGKMNIINVCENVMDIFEVTGFSDILDIEE